MLTPVTFGVDKTYKEIAKSQCEGARTLVEWSREEDEWGRFIEESQPSLFTISYSCQGMLFAGGQLEGKEEGSELIPTRGHKEGHVTYVNVSSD